MPVPRPLDRNIGARRTLRDDVFDRILEAILEGDFVPGERLHDDELREWLGVSRTPIRDAIGRLVELQLVEMEPNRYTRVAHVNYKRLAKAVNVINVLTKLAVRDSITELSDIDIYELTKLSGIYKKDFSSKKQTLNVCALLHAYISFFVEHSKNDVTKEAIERLWPKIYRGIGYSSSFLEEQLDYAELDKILDLVDKRNPELVCNVFEVLFERIIGLLLDCLNKN